MQNLGAHLHSAPNNVLSSASYDRKQVNHINIEYENYITIIKFYHSLYIYWREQVSIKARKGINAHSSEDPCELYDKD